MYDFITSELRADLITMVREDSWPEMTDDQGQRGVNQVAAFLAVAANTTERATPSLRVDLFWHALVLHTKDYARVCDALGGGFIHHVPDRNNGHDPAEGRAAMRRTAEVIRSAGSTWTRSSGRSTAQPTAPRATRAAPTAPLPSSSDSGGATDPRELQPPGIVPGGCRRERERTGSD
ncbi:hypothetical protein [Streptomyces sp. NPDC047315]|uniref:hypothetical protein n=1 Tax=Streptomyces sp. NPDC047315 TaxID=3155142 RepID=UPI0033F28F39